MVVRIAGPSRTLACYPVCGSPSVLRNQQPGSRPGPLRETAATGRLPANSSPKTVRLSETEATPVDSRRELEIGQCLA